MTTRSAPPQPLTGRHDHSGTLTAVLHHHFGGGRRWSVYPDDGASIASWFPGGYEIGGRGYLIDPAFTAADADEASFAVNDVGPGKWRITEASWHRFPWNPRVVYVFDESARLWKRREVAFTATPKPSWGDLRVWAAELGMELWVNRQPQRIGEMIKESRDVLLARGIDHPRGAGVLHTGAGLQHMPALTYRANRSAGAGVRHPRAVMRDKDGGTADLWTQGDAHRVLEDLSDATNTLESARNLIQIRHVALEATIKDPNGGLPAGSDAAAIRKARLDAYNQLFEESQPEKLDALMLAEAKKLGEAADLPDDLDLAKEVLIERVENAATGHQKALKSALTQDAIDNWAACVDQDDALTEIAKECALGSIEIRRADTVEKARAAFGAAKAKIEAVAPLNTPVWKVNNAAASGTVEIAGKSLVAVAAHPAGSGVPGSTVITIWSVRDANGGSPLLRPTIGPPQDDQHAHQFAVIVPDAAKFPVTFDLTAISLCGPSRLRVKLTG